MIHCGDNEQEIEDHPADIPLQSIDYEREIEQSLGCEIEIPVENFHVRKEENREEKARNSLKKPEKSAAGGNGFSHATPPESSESKLGVEQQFPLDSDRKFNLE